MQAAEAARFTLRLEHEDAANVAYGLDIELGDSRVAGSVNVELGAGAVVINSESVLPGWLQSTVVGLVRSLWRARRNVDEPPPWPRRLTRWRHPEGAQAR